ncbi:MAG: PF20097 family protein [Herbinix sp.]|nr:PF20097 family protein [Herbinix sp.]
MSEKCPYCNKEMQKGIIHSDRYSLKWIPESKDKGAIIAPFIKGKKLTNINKSYLEVYYCIDCKKMIFEVI